MPTLLELQHAMRRGLVRYDDAAIASFLADPAAAGRLNIYRNTFLIGLTKALRLSYPAVERLVGAKFFEQAAALFITKNPPRVAYLDHYGGGVADFLRAFPPAASLVYLADVARLEWAVNSALHAADAQPVELAALANIAPNDQSRVSFVAHPSVCLLRLDYPADHIWRSVLAGDDRALATLSVDAASVYILVERRPGGIEVVRLNESEWRFLTALCDGEPLHSAIDSAADIDASDALAEHLAAGRFVAFKLTHEAVPKSNEVAA